MLDPKTLIPHRPPFLFIDEIVNCDSQTLVAKRLLRGDEPQFVGHYPGNPLMPGVLICEAVFQAAAAFLAINKMAASGGLTPVLAKIEEAKFKTPCRPGDLLTIEVKWVEALSGFQFMTGKVTLDSKLVASLKYALTLTDKV